MSATPEPWLDSEAVQAIGPLEAVYPPDLGSVSPLLGPPFVLATVVSVSFLLLTMARFDLGSPLLPGFLGGDLLTPILHGVLMLASWVYVGWHMVKVDRVWNRRFLLGREGFAEWTRSGTTVVFWVELGRSWRLCGCRGMVPGYGLPVLLTLEHVDGTRWYLFDLYTDGERICQRIEGRLLYRAIGEDEYRLPDDSPPPALASLEPGPWLHCEAAWQIEPIERVCKPTAWSDFLLFARPMGAMYLRYGVAAVIAFPLVVLFRDNILVWPLGLILLVALLVVELRWKWNVTDPHTTRILLGAGGLVVYLHDRQWLFPWEELTAEGREVARAGPAARERLFMRLLLAKVNQDGFQIDPNVFVRHTGEIVARLLGELRLRALIPPEATAAPPRLGILPDENRT
jgi:hypothetical protein